MNLINEIILLILHYSEIPAEKWCILTREDEHGNRCAHGHCATKTSVFEGRESGWNTSPIERKLMSICYKYLGFGGLSFINNYKADEHNDLLHTYNQDTPKERVMAFLNDCLKKELEEINAKLKTNEKIVYVTVDQVVKDLTKLELINN